MLNPPDPARFGIPGILLGFRNFGHTPATDVVSWVMITITDPNKESTLVAPQIARPHQFATTLPPNLQMPKPLWYARPLTSDEITDVKSGKRPIYVYGRIEYVDAFKEQRFTNFRLKYVGTFPPPPGVIFHLTEAGNDTDYS